MAHQKVPKEAPGSVPSQPLLPARHQVMGKTLWKYSLEMLRERRRKRRRKKENGVDGNGDCSLFSLWCPILASLKMATRM